LFIFIETSNTSLNAQHFNNNLLKLHVCYLIKKNNGEISKIKLNSERWNKRSEHLYKKSDRSIIDYIKDILLLKESKKDENCTKDEFQLICDYGLKRLQSYLGGKMADNDINIINQTLFTAAKPHGIAYYIKYLQKILLFFTNDFIRNHKSVSISLYSNNFKDKLINYDKILSDITEFDGNVMADSDYIEKYFPEFFNIEDEKPSRREMYIGSGNPISDLAMQSRTINIRNLKNDVKTIYKKMLEIMITDSNIIFGVSIIKFVIEYIKDTNRFRKISDDEITQLIEKYATIYRTDDYTFKTDSLFEKISDESTTKTSIAFEFTRVSAISSACSPLSGWEISISSVLTPNFFAYTGSNACSASTNAHVPPFF